MGAALISMAMIGCTNEELIESNESQLFTLEVGKGVESRTYLMGNQLVWSPGDQIYVTSADGKVNGVLTLISGAHTPNGKFQGTVNGRTDKLKNIVFPAQVEGMSMAKADVNKMVAPMTGTIGGEAGNALTFNCGFVKMNVLGLEDNSIVNINGTGIGGTLKYDVASNSWVPAATGSGNDIEVVGAEDATDFIVPVYTENTTATETTLNVSVDGGDAAEVVVDITKNDVDDVQNLFIIGEELVNPSDEEAELPAGAIYVETTDELHDAYYAQDEVKNIIVLGEGEFRFNARISEEEKFRDNLTILGSKKSKIIMEHPQESYIQCRNLTIDGCTILRRTGLYWGFLNLSAPNTNYTISNCYFTGDDRVPEGYSNENAYTTGIYINAEANSNYHILNCTFDGDFGGEGPITIQNDDVENYVVNVYGCRFINRGEQSKRNIFVHYKNSAMTLNTDVKDSEIHWAKGKPEISE